MAKNKSEEINFQQYVDSVKQKQIPWNIFINLLQDISNSDADRLRKLNAILLTELTLKHSNTEKLKYLNDILLSQFKNYIENTSYIETTENENLEEIQESKWDQDVNEEEVTSKEKSRDSDIHIPIKNKIENNIVTLFKEEILECNPSETSVRTI